MLMHPTSFPSPHGIGDIGPQAHRFIDWLAASGQSVWQMLPLVPSGEGGSPYSSTSAFAGNPLLISPDELMEEGLLIREDFVKVFDEDEPVDFDAVTEYKEELLHRAWTRFRKGVPTGYAGFCKRRPAGLTITLFTWRCAGKRACPGLNGSRLWQNVSLKH